NLLVQMYGACGCVEEAKAVFEGIHGRNVFSWNLMLLAYAQNGYFLGGRKAFDQMPSWDVVSWSTLVTFFCQTGDIHSAKNAFDCMPQRELLSWNTLLAANARNGQIHDVQGMFWIFHRMPQHNLVTWNVMLSGFAQNGKVDNAKLMFESLPARDTVSWNTMMSSYSATGGFLEESRDLFFRIPRRDLVSWNSMLVALVLNDDLAGSRTVFDLMPRRDVVSWKILIQAYIHNSRMAEAQGVVESMVDPSVESWNILLHGYGQNRNLEEAKLLFDKLHERDAMSWSSILCAYVAAGLGAEALMTFREMDLEGFRPSTKCLVAVLDACGSLLGDFAHCKIVHSSIAEAGLDRLKGVETSIISMYSRCGSLRVAREIFDKRPQELRARWSSMIAGYAQNGHAREALDLFRQMLLDGVEPNSITLVSIISACSHTGALGDGLRCFGSLRQDFNIVASDDIYKCVVDVLGRAGMLSEAEEFISAMMPFEADSCTWMSLLGSCRSHGDVRRGQKIAAMEFEAWSPTSSTFVLLSNLCIPGKSL
ncbi:hypothetical protein SELMODRAFT_99651, partial [Selaginella moellendorffii]